MSDLILPKHLSKETIVEEKYKGFYIATGEINGEWIAYAVGTGIMPNGDKRVIELGCSSEQKGVENSRNGVGRELKRIIDIYRKLHKKEKLTLKQ